MHRQHPELAVAGGSPSFPETLPFVSPPTPSLDRVTELLAPSWDQGRLTNGPLVCRLEEQVALRLDVPHVVAVASCTAGLMLVLRALQPAGPVIVPSFTFSASAHAVAWNATSPIFVECEPETFQIDLEDAATHAGGAAALMATHIFGAPCRPEAVEELGVSAGIPVVFDAAHALGAGRAGRPVGGFGTAEVFSLSPTKPLVAGEGGLVATRDDDLASAVRIGRDYGNPGDYDTRFVGLNARMSELHAAVALASLEELDEHLVIRRELATRYEAGLAGLPGVNLQAVDPRDDSTWKDLTIAIEPTAFGVDRDRVRGALTAEGVDTRCYFDPPVHRQHAYLGRTTRELQVTDEVAGRVLSLPIYRSLRLETVDRVCELIHAVHHHAELVNTAINAK